jgi:nucleotide-binding universal stress UspA family protein
LTSETTEPVRLDGTVVVGLSRPTTEDNPELVWALERAVELGLGVHLVHVTERPAYIDGDLAFAATPVHTGLLRQLTELTDRLRGTDGSIEITSAVLEGDPSDAIAAEAAEVGACLVVVGAHHHGVIGDFVAGSVARTPCTDAGVSLGSYPGQIRVSRCDPL